MSKNYSYLYAKQRSVPIQGNLKIGLESRDLELRKNTVGWRQLVLRQGLMLSILTSVSASVLF